MSILIYCRELENRKIRKRTKNKKLIFSEDMVRTIFRGGSSQGGREPMVGTNCETVGFMPGMKEQGSYR